MKARLDFPVSRALEGLKRKTTRLFRTKLFLQAVIAAGLFLFITSFSKLPLNTSRALVHAVRYAVYDEYNMVEVFKRLPSMDEVRDNYLGNIVDWLRQSKPHSSGITQRPILPVQGQLTSGFGWRKDPLTGEQALHAGVDIEAAEGTPVRAVLTGVVSAVWESPTYGKVIELDHGGGIMTLYAHCSQILVESGVPIKQGDVIALVGQTGDASAPHLHFELIENGVPVDPVRRFLESDSV